MNRRNYSIYFAVVLGLTVLEALRKFDALTNPQFFPEDGQVFFAERLANGPFQAVFTIYYGFPYPLQRLVAEVAALFRVADAPLIYNLAAILINSFAMACFCLPHFRHIIRNDYLRIIFCAVILVLPDSGILVNELSNITWWLAIWSVLVCLMQVPRSP